MLYIYHFLLINHQGYDMLPRNEVQLTLQQIKKYNLTMEQIGNIATLFLNISCIYACINTVILFFDELLLIDSTFFMQKYGVTFHNDL